MIFKPASAEAYRLLHEGTLALSNVEANGIRIDVGYLKSIRPKLQKKLQKLEDEIRRDPIWSRWKLRFGDRAKIGAGHQLVQALVDEKVIENAPTTKTGALRSDESVFDHIKHPIVEPFRNAAKVRKVLDTYLTNIEREVTPDGFIHSFYNLNTARTYRSSSDRINFQNQPNRIEWMRKVVRRCFIPRRGCQLGETDYSMAEVRTSACYHKDPTMLEYILNPAADMHKDLACDLFKCRESDVSKEMRHVAKNKFVFPQFYGDYYLQNAEAIWTEVNLQNLTLSDGTGVVAHLKGQGIKARGDCVPGTRPKSGTFERHVQKIEDRFWNERFKVYNQWRKDWWLDYCENLGMSMLSGFRVEGVIQEKDAINYPIQGAAFHCLLWSLIRLVKLLKKFRMKTRIVGQIHDSIVADIAPGERNDFFYLARDVMSCQLRKAWRWLIVPMPIDAEVAEPDASWYEKKSISIED